MSTKCKVVGCENPVSNGRKYCNKHMVQKNNRLVKGIGGIAVIGGGFALRNKDKIITICKKSGPQVAKGAAAIIKKIIG